MHILFFEMPEFFQYNDIKYYRYKTTMRRAATGKPVGPHSLGYRANRIWSWNPKTDEVRFIKNRQSGIMAEVDRNEFLLIQLQAVEWKNI